MIVATFVVLCAAAVAFGVRLVLGPSLSDRVVAVNGLLLVGMAGIAAHAAHTGTGAFLPTLVVVSLVWFVSTATIARFIEGRRR
jgi:multicomponent Na+:H+ antiporter subunit F